MSASVLEGSAFSALNPRVDELAEARANPHFAFALDEKTLMRLVNCCKRDVNPIAQILINEWGGFYDGLAEATGDLLESHPNHGLCFGSSFNEARPATLDECCEIEFIAIIEHLTLDVRKPLVRPLANWLRKTAQRFIEAADAIAAIKDDRDRNAILRLLAGDENLRWSHEHGIVDISTEGGVA